MAPHSITEKVSPLVLIKLLAQSKELLKINLMHSVMIRFIQTSKNKLRFILKEKFIKLQINYFYFCILLA